MARLLLLIAIVATGWYLYRLAAGRGTPAAPPPVAPAPAMNRCAECGVHAPEGDGVRYQTLFFCCPQHLDDYVKRQGPR